MSNRPERYWLLTPIARGVSGAGVAGPRTTMGSRPSSSSTSQPMTRRASRRSAFGRSWSCRWPVNRVVDVRNAAWASSSRSETPLMPRSSSTSRLKGSAGGTTCACFPVLWTSTLKRPTASNIESTSSHRGTPTRRVGTSARVDMRMWRRAIDLLPGRVTSTEKGRSTRAMGCAVMAEWNLCPGREERRYAFALPSVSLARFSSRLRPGPLPNLWRRVYQLG